MKDKINFLILSFLILSFHFITLRLIRNIKLYLMRFSIFIPLILCDIFCAMMLISSVVVGPSWKFWLSLVGVIIFTVSSIIAGGAILREGEQQNPH